MSHEQDPREDLLEQFGEILNRLESREHAPHVNELHLPAGESDVLKTRMQSLRTQARRFMLPYKCAIAEMNTKLEILQEEFRELGNYNPIDQVSGRLKSFESILEKVERRHYSGTLADLKGQLTDIAGVRVTCSFIADVYTVRDLLLAQSDITVVQEKDYIKHPKGNGYRSLHLLLEIPVFLSSGPESTIVEVQIRTKAMDFWASLEHKIYYKYHHDVPQEYLDGLREAARTAHELDQNMQQLHRAIRSEDHPGDAPPQRWCTAE